MAAFDFGEKVDPRHFEKYSNSNFSVNIKEYFKKSLDIVKKHFGKFIFFNVLLSFATLLPEFVAIKYVSFAVLVVMPSFYAGYVIVAFKFLSSQSIKFSDFFKGFNYFLPLFFFSIVSIVIGLLPFIAFVLPGYNYLFFPDVFNSQFNSLLQLVVFIFLLVPVVYLGVCYMFAIAFIIDYRMGFWQAMEISRMIISKHWASFFGFSVCIFMLQSIGSIVCSLIFIYFGQSVIGIVAVSVPLGFVFSVPLLPVAIAYNEIIGLVSDGW